MLFALIGLTSCEKPDYILLTAHSNVKFHDVDPGQDNNDPVSDIPEYLNPGLTYGSVTDIEGNIYRTIQIGTQTWMAENLRTTKFNDGTNIRNGAFGYDTKKYGSYWWYNNDPENYRNSYGALFNWYALNTGRLCPTGWHVPSDDEWKQLEVELGMTREEANSLGSIWDIFFERISRGTNQGDQLKATILWQSYVEGVDDNGTNASGFSAIPCGYKGPYGYRDFYDSGLNTSWWSSTEMFGEENLAISRSLSAAESGVFRCPEDQRSGFSVRCLKNN